MEQQTTGADRDEGGFVLIGTLILTVVLSLVVLAILGYATTGLRAANVTTERTENAAAAAAGVNWAAEELSQSRLICDGNPFAPDLGFPELTVACTAVELDSGATQATIRSFTLDDSTGGVTATVEFDAGNAAANRPVRVTSWITRPGVG